MGEQSQPVKHQVPSFLFPPVKIPQADGSVLIKPGRAVPVGDEIGTVEAARLLGLSPRRMQVLFESENFKTAFKPGGTPKSNWRVSRSEVLSRRSCQGEG